MNIILDTVKLLFGAGAKAYNPDLPDYRSAVSQAEHYGQNDILQLLKKYYLEY